MAAPFLVPNFGERNGQEPRTHSVESPLPAVTGHGAGGIIAPFVIQAQGPGYNDENYAGVHSASEPLRTLLARNNHGVCLPFMVDIHNRRRDDNSSDVEQPLPTIVGKPGNSVCLPFITQYNGTGEASSVQDPLTTVTAKHRHGLAMVQLVQTMHELGVVDIGFRMLDVDELSRATGFPDGYYLHGSKADQIRQIGNAVPPVIIENICKAIQSA